MLVTNNQLNTLNAVDLYTLVENAFTVLKTTNSGVAALSPDDLQSAIQNFTQEMMESLKNGFGLNDAIHNGGHAALAGSDPLAHAVGNKIDFLDQLLNTVFGIADEENIDHLTCERDLNAEAEAQYASDMADYIATYVCTEHSDISPYDLQSIMDDMGVPEHLQASVTATLETQNGFQISQPEPIPDAWMIYNISNSDAGNVLAAQLGMAPGTVLGMTPLAQPATPSFNPNMA